MKVWARVKSGHLFLHRWSKTRRTKDGRVEATLTVRHKKIEGKDQ